MFTSIPAISAIAFPRNRPTIRDYKDEAFESMIDEKDDEEESASSFVYKPVQIMSDEDIALLMQAQEEASEPQELNTAHRLLDRRRAEELDWFEINDDQYTFQGL